MRQEGSRGDETAERHDEHGDDEEAVNGEVKCAATEEVDNDLVVDLVNEAGEEFNTPSDERDAQSRRGCKYVRFSPSRSQS